MQIKGRVVNASGEAVGGAKVEVTGTATAKVMIPAGELGPHSKPSVSSQTVSSAPVTVTTAADGSFAANVPTPTIDGGDGDLGHVIGTPTHGAKARALGSVGETLATAARDHVVGTTIDLGTIKLPAPGPAFQTQILSGTQDLGPRQKIVKQLVAVGAGPMLVEAMTMKQVVEPPDANHLKPIKIWEEDQPAGARAWPLEGTGTTASGTGSITVNVAAGDGGPRHVWVVEISNPTAKTQRIEWSIHYATTHPIVKKRVLLSDLNQSVSRLLQLGPADVSEPPIKIVIGQELKVVVRPDWQAIVGQVSTYDVPGIVKIEETGTVRPVLEFRALGDRLALVMNLTCDVGSITGSVADGWVGTATASDLAVTFVMTFGVEQQMIVPRTTGTTDARFDTSDGPIAIGLALLTLGISQAIIDKIADGINDAIRKEVTQTIPAALDAKRFALGKPITAIFAGPDKAVIDISIDVDAVLITYVDDGVAPLPSLDPEAQVPNLQKIDHIVVLMMENRSFDTMLGYLQRDKGRTDVDGLIAPDGRGNTSQYNEYDGENYQPYKLTSTQVPTDVDPCHSTGCVALQIEGMGGFVQSFAKRIAENLGAKSVPPEVMGYHGADHVWAYDAIAENFAICDKWFASHPGPTWPNRYFLISCHLGIGPDGGPDVDMTGDPTPIEMGTIFDELTARNVSWRYFEHDVGFLRKIAKYTLDFTNVVTIDHPETGFFALAASGHLPSVTFIDPNFVDFPDGRPSNDDHPPTDIAPGQELIAQIYNALRASPNWASTMFVITYDEHGGIYDHYPPPQAAAPPGSLATYGVRVPAMVISPWVPARSVSHTKFDHTSVAKTIFRRFAPGNMPDLGARFDAADHLGELLALDAPRTDAIPSIARPAGMAAPVRSVHPVVADDELRKTLSALRAYVDARRPPNAKRTT